MTLKEYLQERYTKGTTERYYNDILSYLKTTTQAKAQTATYSDIMNYIGTLRKKYNNPETIKVNLQAIKKYYFWLNHTGQRKDHPCRNLRLKDKSNRDVQLQDLFTTEELEQLMERKERYQAKKIRNQVITSLLIYQGLTAGEIRRLEAKDIDLEKGTIYIKSTPRTNSRTLKLKSNQIMLLYKYMSEVKTEKLINTDVADILKNLLRPFKPYFTDRKLNAKTIRQSVIANLLKSGHDLRLVQVFAGHKYPGTTENYRQTGIEELKAGIEKYHPLNK